MIPGAPSEAQWLRAEPRRQIPAVLLEQMVRRAFPEARILGVEALSDGFRNSNFQLQLDSPRRAIVLRVYEHDRSLCQKEVDLLRLLRSSVPVPEVLYAEPQGCEDFLPLALMEYVEGISLRELKRSGTSEQIAEAAQAAGKTLAAIGRISFPKSGWLAPSLTVTTPLLEGADPLPRFVDLCLASPDSKRRLGPDLCESIHRLLWQAACCPRIGAGFPGLSTSRPSAKC